MLGRALLYVGTVGLGAALGSCEAGLGEREAPPSPPRTLGEIAYAETCQRLAYSGELADYNAGRRPTLDASGVGYRAMCRDGAAPPAGAPQLMQEVAAQRQAIIGNVDTMVPAALYDALDQALRATLPALDGEAAAQAVQGTGAVLSAMAQDPLAVAAVTRLSLRSGYRLKVTEGGLARGVVGYPQLTANVSAALPVLWPSSDGLDDAPGAAGRLVLFSGIARELAAATAVPKLTDPERSARLLGRLMLTENPELATLPSGQGYYAVLRDPRGAPQLNTPGGVLPAPFVDKDGDGLADLDVSGRFVGASGAALPAISPFPLLDSKKPDNAAGRDAVGRALTTAGGTTALYRYQNLDDTVLAALLRESAALLAPDRDVPLRLLRGAGHLLGPRVPAHRDYPGQPGLDYPGFDAAQSPLLDLAYGYLQLLTYSTSSSDGSGADLQQLLRGTQLLLLNQESAVVRLLDALGKAYDESRKPSYDAAALAPNSTLFDDLAPILVRLLRQPALVSDLIAALGDPAAADLGQLAAILATDRSLIFMNQSQLDYTVPSPSPIVGSLGKLVNRNLPDSDLDKDPANPQNNRSILQRVLHVLHDTNGVQLCNRQGAYVNLSILGINISIAGPAAPCALYKIDDVASYFLLSIADQSVKNQDPYANFLNTITDPGLKLKAQALDLLGGLGSLIGIPGFNPYPAPQQLGRMLFQNNNQRADFFKTTLDYGSCAPKREGTLCSNQNTSLQAYHDGALFAFEAVHPKDTSGNLKQNVNFYTAFRPIVNAFARYQECTARDGSGSCVQKRNAVKILADLLSVLHRHWSTAQSVTFDVPYEPQQQHSGVVRYEPLLAAVLGQGDLWTATTQLAPLLSSTRLDDGSNLPVAQAVTRLMRWLFDPEAPRLGGPLVFRDGRTAARRNDGKPTFQRTGDPVIGDVLAAAAEGVVTPYDLLADAYLKKNARFAGDATALQRQAQWVAARSAAYDELLLARPVAGGFKFQNPRLRGLLLATLDHLRDRVLSHGKAGDLAAWAQRGLYSDLQSALLGPVMAGAVDALGAVADVPAASRGLGQLLSYLLADPGAGTPDAVRFQSLLTLSADLLQLLQDDTDLVPLLHAVGLGADPQNGALDGGGAVLRRSLPLDPQNTLLAVGKNLFRADASGRYPADYLGETVVELNRPAAGTAGLRGTDLTAAEQQALLTTVGQFLADNQRGARRIVDIIRARTSK